MLGVRHSDGVTPLSSGAPPAQDYREGRRNAAER